MKLETLSCGEAKPIQSSLTSWMRKVDSTMRYNFTSRGTGKLLSILQRWGDAPIHTIAAALFARKDQIVCMRLCQTTHSSFIQHFFNDIGYRHNPFQHCPQGDVHQIGRCRCDPDDNFGEFIGNLPENYIVEYPYRL